MAWGLGRLRGGTGLLADGVRIGQRFLWIQKKMARVWVSFRFQWSMPIVVVPDGSTVAATGKSWRISRLGQRAGGVEIIGQRGSVGWSGSKYRSGTEADAVQDVCSG